MGKVFVTILATCAALCLIYMVVGSRLVNTAFNLPHFHTPISWGLVVGGLVCFGVWRIVKGK